MSNNIGVLINNCSKLKRTTDPGYAFSHAVVVVGGPFLEGEGAIFSEEGHRPNNYMDHMYEWIEMHSYADQYLSFLFSRSLNWYMACCIRHGLPFKLI